MRLAIFQTMTPGPGVAEGDQRLWFVVDELDALGPIDGLKDALARLRKFGGRCVLGFQSIAQVSSTYGHGEAQTIVENCSNTLILRCSSSENGGTARFASKLIGEREVIRPTLSRTRRTGIFAEPHHSVSRGEQHVTESAVLAAEVEQLPDLQGYLKFASHPAWLRVRPDKVRRSVCSARDQHQRSKIWRLVGRRCTSQRSIGVQRGMGTLLADESVGNSDSPVRSRHCNAIWTTHRVLRHFQDSRTCTSWRSLETAVRSE